jgi:hypothetical protein
MTQPERKPKSEIERQPVNDDPSAWEAKIPHLILLLALPFIGQLVIGGFGLLLAYGVVTIIFRYAFGVHLPNQFG